MDKHEIIKAKRIAKMQGQLKALRQIITYNKERLLK